MNNLFNAFSIKVGGQNLDNLKYFQYTDFSTDSLPTDAQTLEKAVAYIRMRHLQRKLSDLSVPVYKEVYFGTAGTSKLVPANAEIVVSYTSIEPFLSTLQNAPSEQDRYTAAANVIKGIVQQALNSKINEIVEVQKTSSREEYAGSASQETFTDVRNVYVDAPAVTPTVTVEYLQIKS